jgi:adenylate cyclase
MAMELEIERKFLVIGKPEKPSDAVCKIRQGYVARENGNVVRIRDKNGIYILNIKTPDQVSGGRHELEYEISKEEGELLFASIAHEPICKTREVYKIGDLKWEVDIFDGENKGLIIVEVELESLNQTLDIPDWIGPEVTAHEAYYNENLVNMPFNKWNMTYSELIKSFS